MSATRPPIRIIIADDHPLLCDGLKMILEQDSRFMVVGCASSGDEAFKMATELLPDVAILDVFMNGGDGIEAVRRIKDFNPKIKTLSLSGYEKPEIIDRVLNAGGDGFLAKTSSDEVIKHAIRAVYNNLTVIDESLLVKVREHVDKLTSTKFTKREMQVIKAIISGKANKVIAAELDLTEGTVKNIVSGILSKTGAGSRTQMVSIVRAIIPELY